LRARFAVLHLHNSCFTEAIDRHDVEIVILAFRNGRISYATQRRYNRRDCVVVTGDEDSLTAIGSLQLLDEFIRLIRLEQLSLHAGAISERLDGLLRAFILRRVDRVYARLAKHTRDLLCAYETIRREIRIRVAWLDV